MDDIREIKITVPEGMEIDKENSTFECIKFKSIKFKRWRDDKDAPITGYYIKENATIYYTSIPNTPRNYNVFATEKQAKSALAMARISQIMANDDRFGGVVTDEEWMNEDILKYVIRRTDNFIDKSLYTSIYYFLAFHTSEQRDLFLEENEDLVKDYLMID